LKKGEYESTADYNDRTSNAIAAGFPEGNRIYAYANMPPSYGIYDADAQILAYTSTEISSAFDFFSVTDGSTYKRTYYYGVPVTGAKGKTRSFIGQNAFGAKAIVEMQDTSSIEIAFRNFSDSVTTTTRQDGLVRQIISLWNIALPMPPDTARKVKGALQVVIAGPLNAPFVLFDKSYTSPTIDIPYGGERTTSAFYLRADCAYIRNRKSGEIYAAFQLPPSD
jgi:hypothetical protein